MSLSAAPPKSTSTQTRQRRRPDGRMKDGILRPLGCEMSCLSNSDGSALWKCGGTHVLAAVYGPVAPQNQNKEHGTKAVVSIIIKPATAASAASGGDNASSSIGLFESQYELCDFLHRILTCCIDVEQYPRCVIEIVLQIVQSDGSILGALLHAAIAALMDGGIDLLYLPIATTCLVKRGNCDGNSNSKTAICLDPTSEEEEEDGDSSLLVVVTKQPDDDSGSGETTMIGSHAVGPGVSLPDLLMCMNVANKAGPAVAAFWRLAVEQKLTRESQTLWSK
jgi:ribonuclease PH